MSVPKALLPLTGRWQGVNRLWPDPAGPADESETAVGAIFSSDER